MKPGDRKHAGASGGLVSQRRLGLDESIMDHSARTSTDLFV